MQYDEYAVKFTNYMCDLMYEHYSVNNVATVLQQIDEVFVPEISYRYEKYGINKFPEYEQYRERILEFAIHRPGYIFTELISVFNYSPDMFKIISDGSCKINTLNGNEGMYFAECSVPVRPRLEKGQVFGHWLVNGEVRREEELTVTVNDAGADGVVYVQLIAHEELPPLFFGEAYDTGEICGFTMHNPTDEVQNTRGLYLSDDINNLRKWAFPAMNINPGSTWEFVGQSNSSAGALLKIGLSFNPRHGEVVFLSNEAGEILDWIAVELTPP